MHACMRMLSCMPTPSPQGSSPSPRIVAKPGAIASYLAAAGISRDELARRMDVATATAYRVDTGRTEPSPAFIAKLMNLTGLAFDDLFVIEQGDAA